LNRTWRDKLKPTAKMVKHIVLWTFRGDRGEKLENLRIAKQLLEGLKGKVPGIVRIEVGINLNPAPEAYDLALYSEFESLEALEGYQAHPEHRAAVDFLRKMRDRRAVVDYLCG
jgi:quinol monooxygenase YgiN